MSLGTYLIARGYDRWMAEVEEACLAAWRAELLADAAGDVLEIGAGTGMNLPHYPRGLERVVVAEPDPHMRGKLEAKDPPAWLEGGLEIRDDPADRMDVPDASFDTVVSTLVLCTVPDPARAVAEVRRVLRPGGRLLFLEHVAAEDNPGRHAWQRRVEPFWRWCAGNCHLSRRTVATIEAAGFSVERLERASMRKAMPLVRPTVRGLARAPD